MVEPDKSHREKAEQSLDNSAGVPSGMTVGMVERAQVEALLAIGDEIASLREAVRDLAGMVDNLRQ